MSCKGEDITSEEQLARWVEGEPVHRAGPNGGECCPDFSCSRPELLALPEIRRAFAAADDAGRMKWLGYFLRAALADRKIYIAGQGAPS
jgi:hypothetical protein